MTRAFSPEAGQKLLARLTRAISRMLGRHAAADDRYRPEKHYMRGPGPKSKRAGAPRQE